MNSAILRRFSLIIVLIWASRCGNKKPEIKLTPSALTGRWNIVMIDIEGERYPPHPFKPGEYYFDFTADNKYKLERPEEFSRPQSEGVYVINDDEVPGLSLYDGGPKVYYKVTKFSGNDMEMENSREKMVLKKN